MGYHFNFEDACTQASPAQEFFKSGNKEPSPQFEEYCREIVSIVSAEVKILTDAVRVASELKATSMSLAPDDKRQEKVLNTINTSMRSILKDVESHCGAGAHGVVLGELYDMCHTVGEDVKNDRVNDTVAIAYKETRAHCIAYAERLNALRSETIAMSTDLKNILTDENYNTKAVTEAFNFATRIYGIINSALSYLYEIVPNSNPDPTSQTRKNPLSRLGDFLKRSH